MHEKRYYWLKLEENYFDLKVSRALRKLPSGAEMLICYLKMQLKYLSTGGLIEYNGIYETLEEEIALDIDEDLKIVQMTMKILKTWHVIEIVENNSAYIVEMQGRIGSKTDSALRVQKFREKQKMLQPPKKEAKSNALRQKQFRAKEYCGKNAIPYIEDYINNKRYNGNYYLVLKRDELQCKICHSKDNLCVHHIDGYDETKPQNNNENKMITLCRKCHSNIHNSNIEISENTLESIDYYEESNDSNEFCNNSVTKCNPIKDIDIEIEKDIEKDNIIYIPQKNDFENEFEELWKIYPNKQGKKNALTKYIKARKDGTTYEEVVEGLKKYLVYCLQNKDWYKPKNGETWFNKQSWNDELTIKTNDTKSLADLGLLDFSKFK
jgi:predicted phage replisome organizer